jgi:hypothetical protein
VPPDSGDLDADGDASEPIPFDLDGNPRIADGNDDGNPVVDMGAYEYGRTLTPCESVIRGIRQVIAEKVMALRKINDACVKECEAHGALEQILQSGDYDSWRMEVVAVKTKIGGAISYQKRCEEVAKRCLKLLEDALVALGVEPEDRQEPEPCACVPDGPLQVDIIAGAVQARADKGEALVMIDGCIAQESALYETLEQLLKGGDSCDWDIGELASAKSKVRFARLFDMLAKKMLENSIDQLDDALSRLPSVYLYSPREE